MIKRNLLMLLVLGLCLSAVACTQSNTDTDKNNDPGKNPGITDTDKGEDADKETADDKDSTAIDETRPAGMLYADFRDYVTENPDATAEQIAAHLTENEALPFAPVSAQMEEGYLGGFSEDIAGFVSAWSFQPMIGTIPFVGYVFEVTEENTEAFKSTLMQKHNKAWNICTEADDVLCESVGDKVFFVMAPDTFEEEPMEDIE